MSFNLTSEICMPREKDKKICILNIWHAKICMPREKGQKEKKKKKNEFIEHLVT